jgi:hypothetical protein
MCNIPARNCVRAGYAIERIATNSAATQAPEVENMTKRMTRILLTILMYAGVVVFLFPYFTGRLTTGVLFMIIGAGATVVFGILRCYLTEGDCGRIPHHSRDW